ncbi:M24 family metallopeptidase [Peribacillus sp. SCS-37]|uniref:M24 family metallopeptidase n=1 Tax=Paraperibacillus esterisolvens TaxID=3115296 RepID=UPI003905A904
MEKLNRLREALVKKGVDGLLIASPYNRRYMTGFTGSAGAALISMDGAKFITDFRYVNQAGEQAEGYEVVQHKGTFPEEVGVQAELMGIRKLGFEQDYLSYAVCKAYEEAFRGELVPVSGAVENLRLIKAPSEIKILKDAAKIADLAFKHIIEYIRPGQTELEVANELEFFMRKQGAKSSSFDIIVASGHRSALPHGVASDKVIQKGDFVTLDYGAYFNGYVSDITRTLSVGEPAEELKKIYNVVLEAQMRAMAGIKPGMTGREADALARNLIEEKGFGEYFGHSTGHGIGLEVHEGPALSVKSSLVLEPGMAVTVEPGIYISGLGGVRIEDDTIITAEGNESLTHSTKELVIL